MPFCYAPWTNVDISPQGVISPCCKFRWDRYDSPPCDIRQNSFDDYRSHTVLKAIKQDFEQGQWPLGCDRCRIEEANNIESKRQLDYTRWKEHYDVCDRTTWLTASLAFGNTCNLTCITCGPDSSSRWQQEYFLKHRVNILPHHFYKQNFVHDFLIHAPEIVHLDIPGGEPFLAGTLEQLDLLQHLVDSGRAPSISLHYTTNTTVIPDQRWWDLWSHFKEIDLQISIDAVGNKNSYIRYPSDWGTIYNNIQHYQNQQNQLENFRMSVSHTVSAYNIYYLPEFLTWCVDQGLPKPWLGRVHAPQEMRPSVWPYKAKRHIIDHLQSSTHQDCHIWAGLLANTDDSDYFSKFLETVQWHDAYRGLSFPQVFPELAPYLDET